MQQGANCQVFAYNVLAHFGKTIPPFRSSDLWEDTAHTEVVTDPASLKLLDLLFFHDRNESYGAHIGIYTGEGKILHLCKEVGKPVEWTFADFAQNKKYTHYLGAKRLRG